MESNMMENEVNVKEGDKLDLIIKGKSLTLNGPWHFDEAYFYASEINMNQISGCLDYLITLEGFNNLVHPEDREYIKNIIGELEEGKSTDYHFRLITPNLEVKQIYGYASLHSQDVSHEKIKNWTDYDVQNELHLKIFRHTERVAEIGSWTWNVKTQELYYSDQFYQIYGLKPQPLPTWDYFSKYIHPDDLERVVSTAYSMFGTGDKISIDYRIYRASDGELRYLQSKHQVFITKTGAKYFIGTTQDITQQKKSDIILDTINEVCFELDKDFCIRYANKKAYHIWDKTTQDIIDKNIWNVLPQYVNTTISEALLKALDTKKHIALNAFSALTDKWMHLSINPTPTGLFVLHVDMPEPTEKEQEVNPKEWSGTAVQEAGKNDKWSKIKDTFSTEVEFAKHKELLRKVLDAMPHLVWISDGKGSDNYFNEAWYTYTGVSGKESLWPERLKAGIIHKSQEEEIMEKWSNCINKGTSYSGEILIKNKDGEYRWHLTLIRPIKDAEGIIQLWFGTLTDVHEQFSIETTLKENKDLLEAIFDSSMNSINVLDCIYNKEHQVIDFRWKYYNKKARELAGNINLIDKRITHIFPGFKENGLLDKLKTVALNGQTIDFEHHYNYDGLDIWFYTVVVKLEDSIILSNYEITERVKAQQALESLNEKLHLNNYTLKSLNDELSTFAFVASHDLREPLRKIIVFSKSLIQYEQDHLSDRGKEYFKRMIAAVFRMDNLIDDILHFSSASSNSEGITEVNLNETIREALNELREFIKEKGVMIEYETMPILKGYRLQLLQLIKNLISNSIKFQKQTSIPHIHIGYKILEGKDIQNDLALKHQKYLRLDVRDNGIGFDEQFVQKIFQMFQRLHSTSEFPGTGMGLTICKKVVENHKGFITANGRLDEGAIFSCYFPLFK